MPRLSHIEAQNANTLLFIMFLLWYHMCMEKVPGMPDSNQSSVTMSQKEMEHFGHLEKGVKPIFVCVGTPEDFYDADHEDKEDPYNRINFFGLRRVKNVNFLNNTYDRDPNSTLNGGHETYVISAIDNHPKYSERFLDCTGLVVVGIDKETGENISFLSHQWQEKFLHNFREIFLRDLHSSLSRMKAICKPGTIDAVMFAGRHIAHHKFHEEYKEAIALLGSVVKQDLGFEPTVVNGPKTISNNPDHVIFDNENRRLYLIRPEVNQGVPDFKPSTLDQHKAKWEEKNK